MTRHSIQSAIALTLVSVFCFDGLSAAGEDAPPPTSTTFVELALYPPSIELAHEGDSQQVVAVATRADGMTMDVTSLASSQLKSVGGSETAVRFADRKVVAIADGVAQLTVEFAGLSAHVDINSKGGQPAPPVSYRHDVMPVFMRTGCNAGGCHGASRGKDGFRLSLFGFDPEGDHFRLTREAPQRRINLAFPDDSLLLQKAITGVAHTGGKRFEPDSVYYRMLRDWIAAGAGHDLKDAPQVTGISLYPPKAALGAGEQRQSFIAVAQYSDGRQRDVTELAVFQTNNESTAEIDADGLVTSHARGEAFVSARFDTHTVVSQVLVLPTDQPFTPTAEAPVNYIDEHVNRKLATLRINPSGICDDEVFLRRVTIDIAGRLPTVEERAAFLADTSPDKRSAKIDELLATEDFAKVWGQKWSDLLLVRSAPNLVEYKPMFLYSRWVTEQIQAGVPLDKIVHSILSSSGSSLETPQVNFYQIERDTKKIAENVAQAFLGIRIQCAQCHNHPFDRWTMDDYYAFTGFFTQIARKRGEDYRDVMVFNRGGGEANHPVGGRVMKPKYLGGDEPDVRGRDRREVVADWIVDPENPYFAVSVANRVWAHYFAVGIVEPVDDIRVSNPPSNPELFELLGKKLQEYDYDIRRLVQDICRSSAYQRSGLPNETNKEDTRNFARAAARRIPAEPLLDCLCQATGSPEKLPGLPLGSRAVEIADGQASNYFLTTFGRSPRSSVCACEATAQPTLSQALHLLNGSATQGKIGGGKLVPGWLAEGMTAEQVMDQIYLRCLTRLPSADERERLVKLLPAEGSPQAALEDIFWAVLNSREFLFNH